jgi:hypothetical protein
VVLLSLLDGSVSGVASTLSRMPAVSPNSRRASVCLILKQIARTGVKVLSLAMCTSRAMNALPLLFVFVSTAFTASAFRTEPACAASGIVYCRNNAVLWSRTSSRHHQRKAMVPVRIHRLGSTG